MLYARPADVAMVKKHPSQLPLAKWQAKLSDDEHGPGNYRLGLPADMM
jgi:hypothetical protein